MGYSATRRSLLRRTRHDDSSGGPSDSFLVAVAVLNPVMCGCLLSAVPGENYQAVVLALPAAANSALWERPRSREFWVGKGPMVAVAARRYCRAMNLLILVIVLLLLFGGGGFYFGGPVIGGGGLGLVLVICLIIYFLGGFRSKAG